jgi:hypothetical protein
MVIPLALLDSVETQKLLGPRIRSLRQAQGLTQQQLDKRYNKNKDCWTSVLL